MFELAECQSLVKDFCNLWGDLFWSYDEIAKTAQMSSLKFFFSFSKNSPVGICILQDCLEFSDLLFIYSDPSFRRSGVGGVLLNEVTQRRSKVLLEVSSSNLAAINLYEKHNFKLSSTRPRYYKNGDDALIFIFTKNLHPNP